MFVHLEKSLKVLRHECLLGKIGLGTAKKEPSKVWYKSLTFYILLPSPHLDSVTLQSKRDMLVRNAQLVVELVVLKRHFFDLELGRFNLAYDSIHL